MKIPLVEMVGKDNVGDFVELTITFIDESVSGSEKILQGVPTIRVNFTLTSWLKHSNLWYLW